MAARPGIGPGDRLGATLALSAILFGVLYQGGAEIAFMMPSISRDMIIIIQGLVILFTGALDGMMRMAVARIFGLVRGRA